MFPMGKKNKLERRVVGFLWALGSQRPAAVTLAPAPCQPVTVKCLHLGLPHL